MTRGRKPLPTQIKILQGTEESRINRREPRPAPLLPRCPSQLSAHGKRAWRVFAKMLTDCGIAKQTDAVALELLCSAYAEYLEASDKVRSAGPVWIEKGEGKIPKFAYSPYWAVANRAWDKVKAMLTEFGMTPSSRSKITVDKPVQEDVEARYFG